MNPIVVYGSHEIQKAESFPNIELLRVKVATKPVELAAASGTTKETAAGWGRSRTPEPKRGLRVGRMTPGERPAPRAPLRETDATAAPRPAIAPSTALAQSLTFQSNRPQRHRDLGYQMGRRIVAFRSNSAPERPSTTARSRLISHSVRILESSLRRQYWTPSPHWSLEAPTLRPPVAPAQRSSFEPRDLKLKRCGKLASAVA
ncbi:hypothetical protein EVAR_21379_1 [Eumeta japonica]|uniref:Uncharacterized protein n=1 Tax=Eumeta variegata TaxID=151549 RepID=A0A4C1VIV9_EUMVA|nr:hypothetical protein EVAR_21379_1 [Eumeta japonica]